MLARLQRMADQIAKNFAALGHDDAVAATADHIDKFWDRRMKSEIFAAPTDPLSPIAAAAVAMLRAGAAPAPQTAATEFGPGHSDAG